MGNKNSFAQLPTALKLDNITTTDKPSMVENFNKHFAMAGHAFHLANPTITNGSSPSVASCNSFSHFSFAPVQTVDVLRELQHLDPFKSAGLDNLDPSFLRQS